MRQRPGGLAATISTAVAVMGVLLFGDAANAQIALDCASAITNLAAFVSDLEAVLAVSRPGTTYGALSSRLDPTQARTHLARLSPERRSALARQLLALSTNPEIAQDTSCEAQQARANAAWLLAEMVEAALASGDPNAQFLFDCFLAATESEQDPTLRRQNAINLDALRGAGRDRLATLLGTANTATRNSYNSRIDKLIGALLPEAPPYATIFGADGSKDVVNVMVHGGDDTFSDSNYDQVFSGPGDSIDKTDPKHWVITHPVTPDDPTGRLRPVTYKIHFVHDAGVGQDGIFRNMGSDEIPIEAYHYHSQYGIALNKSLASAPADSPTKKVFIVGSCKSKVFASRVSPKFPNAQLAFTDDSEYFRDMSRSLKKMLEGFANRMTWPEIQESLRFSGSWQPDNYLTPNERRVLTHLDSDNDGISDFEDGTHDCDLVASENVATMSPQLPTHSHLKIAGEKALYAVKAAEGVLGYSPLTEGFENKFFANGWGAPNPTGPIATFDEAIDRTGNTIYKVKVNAAYSHLDEQALAIVLAREFTLFAGKNGAGAVRSMTEKQKEIAAYEMGVKLMASSWWRQDLYSAYQDKFNLGMNIDFFDASSKIDPHDGVTKATVEHIETLLQRGPNS